MNTIYWITRFDHIHFLAFIILAILVLIWVIIISVVVDDTNSYFEVIFELGKFRLKKYNKAGIVDTNLESIDLSTYYHPENFIHKMSLQIVGNKYDGSKKDLYKVKNID